MNKTIDPAALQAFVKVAELGSFTQAADQLLLPKARVSVLVQQLEARLGARLLHRTTRRVQLTHDGQALFERAQDLLADLDELQSLFQHGGAALRGRLRVDLPTGIACHQVLPRLPGFLQAHPQLEIELGSTDRRVDLVREGFDCVLRVGELGEGGFVARRLGVLPQLNVASPAYLQRHGVPQTLDDLAQHRLVHYASSFGGRPAGWEYHDGEGWRDRPMPGALTVNNAQAYQAACLAGLGLIQAPAIGVAALVAQGLLVEVMPQHSARPLPVSLLYASRRQLPKRVQAFMQWLAETLKPHLQDAADA